MDLLLILALSAFFWALLCILTEMSNRIHRSKNDQKPFDK